MPIPWIFIPHYFLDLHLVWIWYFPIPGPWRLVQGCLYIPYNECCTWWLMKQKKGFLLDSEGSMECAWKLCSFSWCLRGEPGADGWPFRSLKMKLILENRREKQRKPFPGETFQSLPETNIASGVCGNRSHIFIYKCQFASGFLSLEADKVLTARRS